MKTPVFLRVAPLVFLALFGIVVSGLAACGELDDDERPPVTESRSDTSPGAGGAGAGGAGNGGYGYRP
ncbi:MAG TPA: hypothetical protein VM925_31920 [Labilithrix sp.]|jgi:hypothetical protein|nr:hypothetical protein [Labilithrix sp.]